MLGIIAGNASPADASKNSVRQLVFNAMCVAKIVRESARVNALLNAWLAIPFFFKGGVLD